MESFNIYRYIDSVALGDTGLRRWVKRKNEVAGKCRILNLYRGFVGLCPTESYCWPVTGVDVGSRFLKACCRGIIE